MKLRQCLALLIAIFVALVLRPLGDRLNPTLTAGGTRRNRALGRGTAFATGGDNT